MSGRRRILGGLLALLAAAPAPALAQGTPAPAATIDIPIESYKLDNGLKVILSPDHSTPVVAVDLWYDVGSRNERPGRTGFAHLFEHLMFSGSANVAKGEFDQLIERAGGTSNASTTEDRTNYFETLPASRLNLGLWLEADRMRSLAVTQENLDTQREVVKEEKRMRFDNAPYTNAFLAATYDIPYDSTTCPGYAHTVIGSMEDLNAARLPDVKDFFATYYAPDNATLTIVGDFDSAEAKRLVQQYFGDIASHVAPPPVECTTPFTKLPLQKTVEDHNATLPAVIFSYGATAAGTPDSYALDLLAVILGDGESSRMYQRLVKQEKAALEVQTVFDGRRGPGVFLALAISNQGVEPARLQALMEDEIEKVRKGGVTAAELEKARNQYRSGQILGMQTAFGKAERLQYYSLFLGDPAAIRTDLQKYDAVTPADIQRVANQYLASNNRALVIDQPAGAAAVPEKE